MTDPDYSDPAARGPVTPRPSWWDRVRARFADALDSAAYDTAYDVQRAAQRLGAWRGRRG